MTPPSIPPATAPTGADASRLRDVLRQALDDPAVTYGLARALRAAIKELDRYANHQHSRQHHPSGQFALATPRVQVGGGSHRIDGFLNIDLHPPADLIWDVREGLPLPDASVELIFSEHFLEHLDYPRSAKLYCSEAHRVLKPGGQAVTGVPDADFILRAHQRNDENVFTQVLQRWYSNRSCLPDITTYLDLVNLVFRDQDDDPTYNPHYWAYDYDKLVTMFTAAGFTTVAGWSFDPAIARAKRQWGTTYVVATK